MRLVILIVAFLAAMQQQARADVDSWLPDSDSWFGRQLGAIRDKMLQLANFIVDGIKTGIDFVVSNLKSLISGLSALLQNLWVQFQEMLREFAAAFNILWEWFGKIIDAIKAVVVWIGATLKTVLHWFVELFYSGLEFVGAVLSNLWTVISGTALNFFAALSEWYLYYLKRVALWCWSSADWWIGVAYDFFLWLLDQLPEIDLPGGFEQGLELTLTYGMKLNEFVPISETFTLLALYVQLVVALIIYRQVRKLLPFLP